MPKYFLSAFALALSVATPSAALTHEISTVPAHIRTEFGITSPWYEKYVDAGGIPVMGSANVSDKALVKARANVLSLLGPAPSALVAELRRQKCRVVIIGLDETVRNIPEYAAAFHDKNMDARFWGGFGATEFLPITSGTERNILENHNGENVFVHEFAHTIGQMGFPNIDRAFATELNSAWTSASNRKLWANTYAGSDIKEYWAEGLQSYFDVNREGPPDGDGVHNYNNTRIELEEHDPALYRLIRRIYGDARLKNG